jgi:predicted transposase YdaD
LVPFTGTMFAQENLSGIRRMVDKPFDPTLKTLVEVGPEDWTVFAGQPAAPTRIIDADIATVSGAADKVLRVESMPAYLLHLEFVAGHDAAKLPAALNKRNVLLDDRHSLLVRTVVVLLRPAADSPVLTGLHQRSFPEEVPYNVFGYRVIRVWQIPPDQLLAGGLGTLPLAPISAVTEVELPGIIKQMESRLRRREARRLAGQLWAATYILLGLRHSPATAQALLQGVLSMKESTTYQAILQEGLQEGLREGLAEGAVKEARKLLIRLGSKQLGPPSARTQKVLAKIVDLSRLESLIERVGMVESWQALLAEASMN